MSASIRTNLMAANTARTLGAHYDRLSTSVQRLSSGLRINSAADDAAGLAIRELMRADVASFNQGIRNANDAISLIQVADGALAVIDEKLIRMKELSEQAATGTYSSTQRLMIDSEFQAMGSEIDRIARATDFNGVHLLDGSLAGEHDGSGLDAVGRLKIHFGPDNDSAEDYYYIEVGDCTLAGLGLRGNAAAAERAGEVQAGERLSPRDSAPAFTLNDLGSTAGRLVMPAAGMNTIQDAFPQQGTWYLTPDTNNFMFIIPQGTKNIVINATGGTGGYPGVDNDLQLFTTQGVHLAGTPYLNDYVWDSTRFPGKKGELTTIGANQDRLPFIPDQYDGTQLNSGPATYDPAAITNLEYSTHNGMAIGYSGDPEHYNSSNMLNDYEILTIDEAQEDLIVWFTGYGAGMMKAYWDVDPDDFGPPLDPDPSPAPQPPSPPSPPSPGEIDPEPEPDADISIQTQEKAQKMLTRINDAIVTKDKIRAHLGALQNRLENTITNLSIQAENLQASESRISDTDVATEMTEFVRGQILTQSATAMLAQANSLPQMLMTLLNG